MMNLPLFSENSDKIEVIDMDYIHLPCRKGTL
jgi:hypothetical protein